MTDIASVDAPMVAVFKPEDNGPFPGLVLAHRCGGLNNLSIGWTNQPMLTWAREAVARGNAVLPTDQLTLRGFGFVDSERIAVAGCAFAARDPREQRTMPRYPG